MSYTKYKIQDTRYKSSRPARKAFTLMELLIYSGILVISAGLISGIVYIISKANLRTQIDEESNNQLMSFEEVFRQKIQIAKSVNSISGSLLSLEISDVNKDPIVFTLSNDTVFIQEGSDDQYVLNDSGKVKVTSLLFTPTGASGAQISNTYHYAWSENIGWIDFAYPGGNVQVPTGEGDLKGLAYVLSDGSWISLNCISTDSCSSVEYKVFSDANGNLSDWAWSENFGWISFASTTPVTYGVKVATTTTVNYEAGEFDGYAWSENIGWISFNCKTGGVGQANICCSQQFPPTPCSDYRVQDLRMNTSAIKVDLTLQYNSPKPELAIPHSYTFVFNILSPIPSTSTTTITTTTTEPPTTTTTTEPPTTTTTIGGDICTDPGISNVYYNTDYYIGGVSKTGTLQRACYSTGAKEVGITGNFCGDDQGTETAVAEDICNSTKAWVDGILITGNRTDCLSLQAIGVGKTGQTNSYGSSQTCADGLTGGCDDGYYQNSLNGPGTALSYTDNGDGTITDDNTDLMWKRCTEPDTQTSDCTGTHSTYTWADGITRCEGLTYAGFTDWRLPNAKELWGIIKLRPTSGSPNTIPNIDETAFPGTVCSTYWTSTSYPHSLGDALFVSVIYGYIDSGIKTSTTYVRCVRGG